MPARFVGSYLRFCQRTGAALYGSPDLDADTAAPLVAVADLRTACRFSSRTFLILPDSRTLDGSWFLLDYGSTTHLLRFATPFYAFTLVHSSHHHTTTRLEPCSGLRPWTKPRVACLPGGSGGLDEQFPWFFLLPYDSAPACLGPVQFWFCSPLVPAGNAGVYATGQPWL